MKIADKIKYVIAHNPDVANRRAQLRAFFYLHQKHPKKYSFRISSGYVSTSIELVAKDSWISSNVVMFSLSSYPDDSGK